MKDKYTLDGLFNNVTNMGSSLDKSSYTRYEPRGALTRIELEAMYREDWITAKAVDLPAKDMLKNWRTHEGLTDDQAVEVKRFEKRLRLPHKLLEALKWSRLYGGAAAIMRIDGTGELNEPLRLESVKKDSLKYLNVLDRWQISASSVLTHDLMAPNFLKPEFYHVSGNQVHHSRVLRFDGIDLPYHSKSSNNYWGDSIIERMYKAIINAGTIYDSISSMLHEANLDVMKIPGLMNLICDDEGKNQVLKRIQMANLSKSIHNMFIMDSEEEYEKKQNTFTGIQPLIYDYISAVAGAADIPITRLLGVTPGGLNVSGDSDLENYYSHIESEQNATLRPQLDYFDEIMLRSLFGTVPSKYDYEFAAVQTLNDERQAALEKTLIDKHVAASSILPDEVIYEKIRDEELYNISDELLEEAETTVQYEETNPY